MSSKHLYAFLQPASVAVIGATSRADSLGNWAWRNLVSAGFEGQLLPVNLKHHTTLDGHRVYKRVADLPVVPDLALVCTPAATVARVIGELGDRGTRAAVVLTDGLSPAQTAAMLKAARRHTLRIVGDHALGVQVPGMRLNAGVAPTMPAAGQLALVSQCGGVTASMLDWAQAHGIGFSAVVSLGRSADADAADWLDHLAGDHHTRAILLYLDTVHSPAKFMSAARAAARNKPVIVVKAGASGAVPGAHNGDAPDAELPPFAVAPDAVFDAAVARAGLLRVGSLQDLFLAAQVLARFRDGGAGPLVILANGGTGALAADAAQALGVPMATLGPDTCTALAPWLGVPASAVTNPVRVPREASAEVYAEVAHLLCHDPANVLLVAHAPTVAVQAEHVAQALLPVATRLPHRVMAAWLGGGAHRAAACVFDEAGLPTYDTPEQAVQALALLRTHAQHQHELMQTPPARLAPVPSDVEGILALARSAMDGETAQLTGDAALQLLSRAGVPVRGAQPGEADHVPGTRWRITFGVDLTFGPVIGLGTSGLPMALSRHAVALPPLNVPLAHALMARAGVSLVADSVATHAVPAHGLVDMLLSCSQLMVDLPMLAAGQITCVQDRWTVVDAALQLHPACPMGPDRFVIQPYPQHLVETLVWQGQPLTVRPIRPEDEAQHLAFLGKLTPEDIRMRIFHVRRSIEHSEMARLTQIDYAREMAFIATRVNAETGIEETLATVRATIDADNDMAEFGVIVRSDIKAGRLGRLLMTRLIAYLSARGTRQLTGTVLTANTRMLALARSLGFVESDNPDDPTDRAVRFVSLDL